MTDENTPKTEAEIDAEMEAILAADKPKEYIIYPAFQVKDGLIQVTPEVIDSLLQDYLFSTTRDKTHVEGDIGLWVRYEDIKHLIEIGGATVREIEVIEGVPTNE